jgi:hypothetical protein
VIRGRQDSKTCRPKLLAAEAEEEEFLPKSGGDPSEIVYRLPYRLPYTRPASATSAVEREDQETRTRASYRLPARLLGRSGTAGQNRAAGVPFRVGRPDT